MKKSSQHGNKTEVHFVVIGKNLLYNQIRKREGGVALIFVHQFGKIAREKRERQRLTIGAVAEKCGLSDRGLEMIELGDSDPKLSSVLKIAQTLEIDLGEINVCKPEEEYV